MITLLCSPSIDWVSAFWMIPSSRRSCSRISRLQAPLYLALLSICVTRSVVAPWISPISASVSGGQPPKPVRLYQGELTI